LPPPPPPSAPAPALPTPTTSPLPLSGGANFPSLPNGTPGGATPPPAGTPPTSVALSAPNGTTGTGSAATAGVSPPGASNVAGSARATGSSNGDAVTAGGLGSGGVSVSLVRQPSVQETGVVAVSVPKEMATAGSGFTFPLPAQVAETAAAGNAPVLVTTITGEPLPGWLRYVPETKSFVASAVPDGAFPVQIVVSVGGTRTTVVISERAEK